MFNFSINSFIAAIIRRGGNCFKQILSSQFCFKQMEQFGDPRASLGKARASLDVIIKQIYTDWATLGAPGLLQARSGQV